MKKLLLAGACALTVSTGAVAQVNEGQGGPPSPRSGGTMSNPRTYTDQAPNRTDRMRNVAPGRTTGSAPVNSGRNPANGNAGRSGGEGGSGR